jgi:hypothetical protein
LGAWYSTDAKGGSADSNILNGPVMSLRARACRFLKWSGLTASILLLVLWPVSAHYSTAFTTKKAGIIGIIEGGQLRCTAKRGRPVYGDAAIFSLTIVRSPGTGYLKKEISVKASNEYVTLRVPLWVIVLGVGLPTAALFWLGRKRIKPGHCAKCQYDLRGNVSGVCPECGTPVAETKLGCQGASEGSLRGDLPTRRKQSK